MSIKNVTQLSLLRKVPTCSQVIHKQTNKISQYSWESAGMSALVLSISQTAAFQKVQVGVLHQAGLLS